MMFKAILLLAVVAAAAAQTRVNVRDCPGHHPVTWFESHDCTATLCTLRRNQIFAGRAHWTTQRHFAALDITIQAHSFGLVIDMPLEGDEASACNFLESTSCPIAANTAHTWGLRFHIDNILPQLPVTIMMWAGDAAGRSVCGEIDGVIVA